MQLEDYIDPFAYDIAFWTMGVRNPQYPLAELGRLSLELTDKLRAMAVFRLLTDASVDGFCHNLIRSTVVRQTFFARCLGENGTSQLRYCAGLVEPLLDAVAAGDFGRALALDAGGPVDFRPGLEYEDDFCFAKLIVQLASGRPDPAGCAQLLAQAEAYLAGGASARLDVVKALLAGDAAAFEEAFESRLVERELEIEAAKKRGQLEEPEIIALRRVFVEGVALLRLADLLGVATAPDYRLCPSLARLPMSRPFPGR